MGQRIGDEILTRLLAVDSRSHSVFGYDSSARGIRKYTYHADSKTWGSMLIASGLGEAGDSAAWDSARQVIYSTHETADPTVRRHPRAHSASDPTGIGACKPWPLVATSWDGKKWSSRVIAETGVPQLPAVSLTDHTVYYARRDGLNMVRTYRPATESKAEAFDSVSGWSGTDTYEDHDRYTIKQPCYPSGWGSYGLSVSFTNSGFQFSVSSTVQLKGPITVIPYYEPILTNTPLPPRLAHFRAVLNPRQNRLVQHREIYEGEVVRTQTGKRIAGYLYRDADGVLATSGKSRSGTVYPALGDSFDPANPPASFAALADPASDFIAVESNTSLGSLSGVPTTATTDPNAPFVAPHLRLPTSVRVRTFGHRYDTYTANQPGGRYRNYSDRGTSFAELSSLAVDTASGITFYIQAPPPATRDDAATFTETHSSPPLAGFRAASDFKLYRPDWRTVWIVMVY